MGWLADRWNDAKDFAADVSDRMDNSEGILGTGMGPDWGWDLVPEDHIKAAADAVSEAVSATPDKMDDSGDTSRTVIGPDMGPDLVFVPEAPIRTTADTASIAVSATVPEAAIASVPELEAAIIDLPEPEVAIVSVPEPEAAIVNLPEPEVAIVSVPEPEAAIVNLPEPEAAVSAAPATVYHAATADVVASNVADRINGTEGISGTETVLGRGPDLVFAPENPAVSIPAVSDVSASFASSAAGEPEQSGSVLNALASWATAFFNVVAGSTAAAATPEAGLQGLAVSVAGTDEQKELYSINGRLEEKYGDPYKRVIDKFQGNTGLQQALATIMAAGEDKGPPPLTKEQQETLTKAGVTGGAWQERFMKGLSEAMQPVQPPVIAQTVQGPGGRSLTNAEQSKLLTEMDAAKKAGELSTFLATELGMKNPEKQKEFLEKLEKQRSEAGQVRDNRIAAFMSKNGIPANADGSLTDNQKNMMDSLTKDDGTLQDLRTLKTLEKMAEKDPQFLKNLAGIIDRPGFDGFIKLVAANPKMTALFHAEMNNPGGPGKANLLAELNSTLQKQPDWFIRVNGLIERHPELLRSEAVTGLMSGGLQGGNMSIVTKLTTLVETDEKLRKFSGYDRFLNNVLKNPAAIAALNGVVAGDGKGSGDLLETLKSLEGIAEKDPKFFDKMNKFLEGNPGAAEVLGTILGNEKLQTLLGVDAGENGGTRIASLIGKLNAYTAADPNFVQNFNTVTGAKGFDRLLDQIKENESLSNAFKTGMTEDPDQAARFMKELAQRVNRDREYLVKMSKFMKEHPGLASGASNYFMEDPKKFFDKLDQGMQFGAMADMFIGLFDALGMGDIGRAIMGFIGKLFGIDFGNFSGSGKTTAVSNNEGRLSGYMQREVGNPRKAVSVHDGTARGSPRQEQHVVDEPETKPEEPSKSPESDDAVASAKTEPPAVEPPSRHG